MNVNECEQVRNSVYMKKRYKSVNGYGENNGDGELAFDCEYAS